ncbi:hypothetical protein J3R82DRAFT_1909 [Butyriboletus roseoflavus]|nr:hypothetical protein J3R82DRAFT_1909 [Butyriboletus roseoflavus]
MRVLSFIPAILLAAAGFVTAAPASAPADTSCVSNPSGGNGNGNGNDAALQPVISIIANATTYIQPLSGQLAGLKGDSCTPDAVSGVLIQINAVVSTCVAQLQAAATVDLTGLDLTNLCVTIYGLLSLILTVLNALVTIVIYLGADAVGTIQAVLSNLLHNVTNLVGCLKVFADASVYGVLGPVNSLVCGGVNLLLSLVVGVTVAAAN